MHSLIEAYKKKDPAARNAWEIILLYPGVKAVFFHRLAHPLYVRKIPFLPRFIAEFSRWLTGIEIHPGAIIGQDLVIDHGLGIVIGETAIIGNQVLIYQGVTLGALDIIQGKRHPTIEDNVMIGAGSKILGDIIIGKNSKIGANAVVLNDIPPGSVAVGNPAKIIKKDSAESKKWHMDYQI
jgi:serine O-acetyltransferase